MAYLLVESLLGKKRSRFIERSGKILELLVLTVGLISIVLVMKEALLPHSSTFAHFVFGFWSFMSRYFFSSPPTIIIAINLMLLLIFASSTFYRGQITFIPDVDDDDHHHHLQINNDFLPPAPPAPAPAPPPSRDVPEIITPPPAPLPLPMGMPERRGGSGRYINDVSATTTSPPSPKPLHKTNKTRGASQLPSSPKQHHPLGKWKDRADEEYRPTNNEKQDEEEDTMEATWEAITGQGKEKQKTRTKKKKKQSDRTSEQTWRWEGVDVDVTPRVRRLDSEEVVPSSPKWKELRKAETFNDAVSVTRRGGLIRKVPSMSMEEFNHKVEAFINTIKHKPNRTFFDVINRKRH